MNSMLQLTMSLIDDFSTHDWSSCGVRNLLVVGSIHFCLSWFSSHSSREFSQFLRVRVASTLTFSYFFFFVIFSHPSIVFLLFVVDESASLTQATVQTLDRDL